MKICNLASGSKGNSTYIEGERCAILIDCGLTLFEMESKLKALNADMNKIVAVLVTHEHSDHICSLARFAKKYGVNVYVHSEVYINKRSKFEGIDAKHIKLFYDQDFFIEEFTISPVALSHDSVHCVGFSIYAQGVKYSQVTDLGRITLEILEHIEGSSLVLIESNHDEQKLINGPYTPFLKSRILSPSGHLSNVACRDAVRWLAMHGTHNFILGHLSEENNTEELAFSTVASGLKDFYGEKFSIEVASQHHLSRVYDLGVYDE